MAYVDMTSHQYALALAELAHAELWAGHHDTHGARSCSDRRCAWDGRSAGALAKALAAGSMTATVADDMPTAKALAQEALAPALDAGDWWAYVHATMWEANAVKTWASETYSLLMRDRRFEMDEQGGPHAYVAWLSAVEALELAHRRRLAGMRRAPARPALGSDPWPSRATSWHDLSRRGAPRCRGRQAEAESHLLRVEELIVDR